MEYEGVDEATRQEACERVKQIVKAIKAIKIKYYLNFDRISAKDQDVYQKLQVSLEKISDKHNLVGLKSALMTEVDDKYERKNFDKGSEEKTPEPDDILKACYGVIDAETYALSHGKIKQALACQAQRQAYMDKINSEELKSLVIDYKRKKFEELGQTRVVVEEKNESCLTRLKNVYRMGTAQARRNAMETVKDARTRDEATIGEEIVV